MEKQEFIDGLRSSLNGRISPSQLEDTIDYYRDYINVEVRKGKAEREVLGQLGDPRLIARTIIQTSGQTNAGYWETEENETQMEAETGFPFRGKVFRVPGWLLTILILLLFVVVVGVIFSILSFLAPILIALAAVLLLLKIFRDWLN